MENILPKGMKKKTRNGRKSKFSTGISDGWFSETEPMWPGHKFSLALEGFSEEKSVLFCERSKFQSILVFRSAQYGNVLVLDGVVQLTERDEFVFQEMISHLPLFSHPNPQNVLIVGGGDGGVLREVCKHECVQKITMVEIDQMVIDVAKQYFAETTATSFDDPRLTIVHEDAAKFLLRENEANAANGSDGGYDVIIGDTSDPCGPAESLFDPSFYEQMNDALNDGGIICTQGQCFWTQMDLITDVVTCCAEIFDSVEYASCMVPTFPTGQIGFILASKGENINLLKPQRPMTSEIQSELRWYNPSIHEASYVLPHFLEKELAPLRPPRPDDDDDDCFLSNCTIS